MYLNGGYCFNLVYFVSFFFVADNMTGSHSLYTIYEGHEIMFHVSTMLPFTPDNPQQVTNMCWTLPCTKCKIVANFVSRLSFNTPMKGPWAWALVRDIALCSWARHFVLIAPHSTQVNEWVPKKCWWSNHAECCWLTCDGLTSLQGEVARLLVE